MRLRDAVLAALTPVILGLAFVATRLGLNSISAAELTLLRDLTAVPIGEQREGIDLGQCSVWNFHIMETIAVLRWRA